LLGTGLVPSGGIDFEGASGLEKGFHDGVVVALKVAPGSEGEFFDEVGMAMNFKESGTDHFLVAFPVNAPEVLDLASGEVLPSGEMGGVIEVPAISRVRRREVVNRADEVVPFVKISQGLNVRFAASQPVALHGAVNANSVADLMASFRDPIEIARQVFHGHPPVVERLRDVRRVIGDSVIGEACGESGLNVFRRRAFGVMAKRCMGVELGFPRS
jgi:hypothetical protein